MVKPFFIFFALSLTMNLSVNFDKNSGKNYGPYKVILRRLDVCKGPKSKDCIVGTVKIVNNNSAAVDCTIVEKVAPSKGKVIVSIWNSSTDSIRMQLNAPCDNVFLRPILRAVFKMNSKCEALPGHLKFRVNYDDITHQFYGQRQFYGLWTFRSRFYNNKCNFLCTYTELLIVPIA